MGNYNQLTPVNGVNINNIMTQKTLIIQVNNNSPIYYTAFGVNGSALYAETLTGQLLQMNANYINWQQIATAADNLPIIALGANPRGGVYYAPYPSTIAYASTGSGFTNSLDSASISAITASNNVSIYYATSLGNVGLIDNPAGKHCYVTHTKIRSSCVGWLL